MLNEVNLVGRISNVPRISRTKANVSVITCNVANQRSENYVDFIQCVFFDQEYLEKRLKKGMKILVKGRLQQNTYTDADTGTTIYYHEVVGKVLELIGKINTEHSTLCKQDINKIINKTISSYRKPNLWNINITLTEQEYHLYRTSLSILFDLLIRIIKRIIYYTIVKNFKYYLQNNKQKLAYALFATLNDF